MMEEYYLTYTAGHYELLRTIKPGFRAEVDLSKPFPEIKNIVWLENDVTNEERDHCISEALEYLEKLVLMGE